MGKNKGGGGGGGGGGDEDVKREQVTCHYAASPQPPPDGPCLVLEISSHPNEYPFQPGCPRALTSAAPGDTPRPEWPDFEEIAPDRTE